MGTDGKAKKIDEASKKRKKKRYQKIDGEVKE